MKKLNGQSIKILTVTITLSALLLTVFVASSFSTIDSTQNNINNNTLLFEEILNTKNNQITAGSSDLDPTVVSVESVEIMIGESETSTLKITNVTELAALQFSLTYDPSVVLISDVEPTCDLDTVWYNVNNTNGFFNVTWFNLSGGGITGDEFIVSQITFEPAETANDGDLCNLDFSYCVVGNIDLQQIDHNLENGTATVHEAETSNEVLLSIDSAEIPIGGEETVSITANGAENLAAFQINVSYDSSIVSVKEVDETVSVFDEVNYYNHETLGILSLNSFNTTGFDGDLCLVDILFEPVEDAVEGDSCSLLLTDIVLGDSDSQPIDYITQNGTVTILSNSDPPVLSCNAGRSYEGTICTPISFMGSATGGVPPYTFEWDFGDDSEDTGQNPDHQYDSDGLYTVTLTVTDDEGDLDTDTSKVKIRTDELTANANGPYEGLVNEDISLVGSASGGCEPYVYSWDLDNDGEFDDATGPNVDYNWSTTGIKTIRLKVIDSTGCGSDIDVTTVTIDTVEPEDILTATKLVKPDCQDCEFNTSISFDISDEVDFVTYKVDIHIDDLDGTFIKPVEDLQIRDNLPQLSGLSYNDSFIKTGDGTYYHDYTVTVTRDYIYWDFTEYVMPGSSFTLEYCANVVGCGDFENEVNVTARWFDSPCCWRDLYANTSAQVEVICGPGIDVKKEASLNGITWNTHSVNSFVDDTVWFRLTVENSGYEVLDGVNVLDYLPDFLEFDEMIDDGGADPVFTDCENETYDLRWFFTEIDVGETIEIVFTTTVVDVGIDDNHVVVHDCPYEGEPGVGDDDSVEVRVEEGIHVEKQVYDEQLGTWTENTSILPGEILEWKITVSFFSSNASQIMHHILINDTLPEELSYVDDSAVFVRSNGTSFTMNPSIDDEVLTWDLNNEFFLNGDWLTLTFETEVDDDAEIGLLENLVDVTGRVCNGTYYDGFDSATAYVTEIQNLAPEIKSFSPEDEAVDVDIDAELEVTVDDAEDDLLTVTFYDASDDSVIEEITNINPQKTVDTSWEDLEYNTTYEWYVTVADDNQTITSGTWEFTTMLEPTNQAPYEPENPNPADDAEGVMINPTLTVHVEDPDGDELDVIFYDASNDQQIGVDQCTSDCTASTTWTGLVKDTTYSWYVKVSDGEFEVESDTWSFTTETEDIDFEIDISGGLGITVDITNTGDDTATDVDWQIDIENKGLIKRIDKTYSGTDDIPAEDVLTLDKIRLLNIGRITVDITVTHDSLDTPVTKTVDGFVFGIFIRL